MIWTSTSQLTRCYDTYGYRTTLLMMMNAQYTDYKWTVSESLNHRAGLFPPSAVRVRWCLVSYRPTHPAPLAFLFSLLSRFTMLAIRYMFFFCVAACALAVPVRRAPGDFNVAGVLGAFEPALPNLYVTSSNFNILTIKTPTLQSTCW